MLLRLAGAAFAALILVGQGGLIGMAGPQGAGTPATATRRSSDEGAELFRGYCTPCHGREGRGDGPVASALKSRPTDLTRLAATNRGTFPGQRVAMVLEFGVVVAAHGTTDMPTWGSAFRAMGDEAQVRQRVTALTRYLESIQTK